MDNLKQMIMNDIGKLHDWQERWLEILSQVLPRGRKKKNNHYLAGLWCAENANEKLFELQRFIDSNWPEWTVKKEEELENLKDANNININEKLHWKSKCDSLQLENHGFEALKNSRAELLSRVKAQIETINSLNQTLT